MRRRGLGTVLVGVGTTLAMIFLQWPWMQTPVWRWIHGALEHQVHEVDHTWLVELALRTFHDVVFASYDFIDMGLGAASMALLGIIVARGVAESRVRAGMADPLDRLRRRPRLVHALTWLPAVLFAFPWIAEAIDFTSQLHSENGMAWWINVFVADLATAAVSGALACMGGRAGMRSLLAPVAIEEAAPRTPGDIVFSAVAVTARTRGAVAALAAATVAMVAFALIGPNHAAFPWALAAYIGAAMSAPFVMRRVSRIAVGLDGIWVRDASHALFFAYRDLEGARARGADLELVGKSGRTALRLQMHGDDAARRDELLARVQDAVARSRTGDTRGAETLVQAMPARHIVASAAGDARYRMPSISREQLWDLIESPATDASTRTAAAEALAAHIDQHDRARLRVAAEQCAEPRVRVALTALAGADGDEGESSAQAAAPQREQREAGQPSHRLG